MVKKIESQNNKDNKTGNAEFYIQLGIIAMLSLLLIFNTGKIYGSSGSNSISLTGAISSSGIIPKGIPEFYGKELGVKYDDVSPNNPVLADSTIKKLSKYEDLTLNKEQIERYIRIGSSISCEYCCAAAAIIFSNGERACGCAHSYAMRGLAKYLLTNNSDMTDEQILSELGKWKVLFFPGIHEQKAKVLEENGIDSNDYINLASNLYRGIEQGKISSSSGGMVGGC